MIKMGIWRHYKGGVYEVIGFATHTETKEPLIIYRNIHDPNNVWARPFRMWEELVDVAGTEQPRFQWVADNIADFED